MNLKHGKSQSKVYRIWNSMRMRCENPNTRAFSNYGGRGISVCAEWRRFETFLADMGEPSDGMCLERKDNELGYSPENCVWASRTAQGRNKRNNVLLTIGGETMPISGWAERSGLKYATIHQRITKGWEAEDAILPLTSKRKGIPRGQLIHKFGAEHGVVFHDREAEAA